MGSFHFQIYQIYGRKSAEEVHSILRSYGVSYVILEDSICMQPPTNLCATPHLVDIYNGVVRLNLILLYFVTNNHSFCQTHHQRT